MRAVRDAETARLEFDANCHLFHVSSVSCFDREKVVITYNCGMNIIYTRRGNEIFTIFYFEKIRIFPKVIK